MKAKLIIITVLALGSFTVSAQELIAPHQISGTDTVPSDEIWKVESILYINMASDAYLTLNSIQINCFQKDTYRVSNHTGAGGGMDMHEIKLPFWLNSGDVVENLNNIRYISVLRFKKPD
jgi:hypothetical protein